jgi:hypothetical protein
MKKLTAVCIAISLLNIMLGLVVHNWSAVGGWLIAAVWQIAVYIREV